MRTCQEVQAKAKAKHRIEEFCFPNDSENNVQLTVGGPPTDSHPGSVSRSDAHALSGAAYERVSGIVSCILTRLHVVLDLIEHGDLVRIRTVIRNVNCTKCQSAV